MATAHLSRVEARTRLKPRRDPYWQRLEVGRYIGFRKMSPESSGSWFGRCRDQETGKQVQTPLGGYEDLPAHQRYDAAKRDAEVWFKHLGQGGKTEAVTVKKACKDYVAHLRTQRGNGPADDAEMRFKRWVYGDRTLAETELSKLTRKRIEDWRMRMTTQPVKVNRDDRTVPLTRDRSAASVNRDMSSLRAALNRAHDAGCVTTDMAWRVALRPTKNADGRRDVYLDRDQRRQLIAKAQADLATFLRGMSVLPLRPGALAALTVASFDVRLSTLIVGKDKAGQDRRIKVPPITAKFLAEQCVDKAKAAPLFPRADGCAWNKDAWKKPVKAASLAAELPEATTAYALRHSTITDLVTGGLDLLTVAQLSGTSVAMIERHYGHLRADHAAAALARLAL
jgi:integrase